MPKGGAAATQAAKLLATLQTPDDVARLIVALCLDAAAAITGQVFLVARDRVGLFRPRGVDQEATVEAPSIGGQLFEVPELTPVQPEVPHLRKFLGSGRATH